MRRDDLLVFRQAFIVISAILLPLLSTIALAAGEPRDLRKYLGSRANFDAADISKMERGEAVSKLLPVEDRGEVAFCGVISINALPEKGFEIFQASISRLGKKTLIASGGFSDVPTIADLQTLTLEKGDIEALKICRPGSCSLNLSAAMIKRFQIEVEWEGSNYAEQATDLFRRLILEYMLDYQARGEAALIEYNNRPQALSLRSENDILLKELGWINSYAPELFEYLRDRTADGSPNIKRSMSWAKVKFGLKPVIIITEVITYSKPGRDNDLLFSVSRQIYANHYVDSSLGLIAVLQYPGSETSDNSYLLYVNHSHSSALRRVFGKFLRKIVEHEVIQKLELVLQTTRSFVDHDRTKQELPPPAPTMRQTIINWVMKHSYLIGFLILLAAFIIINRFGKPVANNFVDP